MIYCVYSRITLWVNALIFHKSFCSSHQLTRTAVIKKYGR